MFYKSTCHWLILFNLWIPCIFGKSVKVKESSSKFLFLQDAGQAIQQLDLNEGQNKLSTLESNTSNDEVLEFENQGQQTSEVQTEDNPNITNLEADTIKVLLNVLMIIK